MMKIYLIMKSKISPKSGATVFFYLKTGETKKITHKKTGFTLKVIIE